MKFKQISFKGSLRIAIILMMFAIIFQWNLQARPFSDPSDGRKAGTSEWVYFDDQGRLQYKTTDRGDRVLDFSHAGYMGGGVTIPDVPVKVSVSPSGGDDTGVIQSAIDQVSKLPLTGNFRGAVLLLPGDYNISRTIEISASGVVLRGSGSGLYGNLRSTLRLTGRPFNAISVRAPRSDQQSQSESEISGFQTTITALYVPSGISVFAVADASGFGVGDRIWIEKPVTTKWIEYMQMHDLVRYGKPQTWLPAGSVIQTERRITAIEGSTITVDVPLSDSYDMDYLNPPGVVVRKAESSARITHAGVEHLHIVSPPQAISHEQRHFNAFRIYGEDCWARHMLIEETMNSVAVGGHRITLQFLTITRQAKHEGSSRPAEIAPNGGQVLVDRCQVIADNVWFIATGARQPGPMVVLNCQFVGDQRAESHQRWSTGLLYDNVRTENGGIDLRNRGSMGSGHGWSMGWGVAWNCLAKDFTIQNPPGACNWMIGCIGEDRAMPRPFDKEPNLPGAVKDSHGVPVEPASLYLAQLKERLGEEALRNIGY